MRFLVLFICISLHAAVVPEAELELRPSYVSSAGALNSENFVSGGVRFDELYAAGFTQEFFSNRHFQGDTGVEAGDGYLTGDLKLADWVSVEPRVLLPTSPLENQAGLRMGLSPIAKFGLALNDVFFVEVWENPVLPFYENSGYEVVENEEEVSPYANRAFENRMEFYLNATLLEGKLILSLPLIWQQIAYQNFEGADLDGASETILWLYPEVLYSIDAQNNVGLAYYTENLVGRSFGDAFGQGVAQLVYQLKL